MISTTLSPGTSIPDKILALGFHLYIERGCPEGAEFEVWLEAERLLKTEQAAGSEAHEN
jgi:hypothetical protein